MVILSNIDLKNNSSFISLICFASFVLSCSAPQKEMRAYIEPDRDWKMIEACGYESCGTKVDLLEGRDLTLRVEFEMGIEKQFFGVLILFAPVKNKYEFDPSNVMVKFNAETLKAKGFTCSNTIWDRHYFRSNPPLQGSMPIQEGDCFLLFFDRPVPQVEKQLLMNIDEALTANGRSIGVPLIFFRKNLGKQ